MEQRASRDRTTPDIEIYKAVRAHEVMLNQAVSAFEHAVYTRLAALNGGAAAAFVTLLGTQLKSHDHQLINVGPAVVAVLAWLSGLLAASLAALFGFRRQRAINHSYRLMRQEVERNLGEGILAEIVGATRTEEEEKRLQEIRSKDPAQTTTREATEATRSTVEKAAEDRDLRAAYGGDAGKEHLRFNWASGISVVLFVVGAIAALIAVV